MQITLESFLREKLELNMKGYFATRKNIDLNSVKRKMDSFY